MRMRDRRDVLKLGLFLAAGGVIAPLVAACAAPGGGGTASVAPAAGAGDGPSPLPATPALSGSITILTGGADPSGDPAMKKVYDDFRAQHPAIAWDMRVIPGFGADWDRLARETMVSGEPVGLVMIDGLFVRAWVRDGLLADLGADPSMAGVLARVPAKFHLAGPGETTTRAFPLAMSQGVQTTGMYYNRALLDRAGLEAPRTIADLGAMVKPLAALGAAPLAFCSGELSFNSMLVTWVLPMIAERAGDPAAFVESTIRGTVRYDSPEWLEAFGTIAGLRTSGALLEGSGATDYPTMQQLFLQGRAAMVYNGSWLLPALLGGTPTGAFDLHVAPLPLVTGASKARSILSWGGYALPAGAAANHESVAAFLEYASRPEVDKAVVEGRQAYSPIPESNVAIHDAVAREFLPMFDDAITPLNWLWEPEIEAEINDQVQALVKGATDPAAAGKAIETVAAELRSSGRGFYS
jgi:ABC-type glycerol-3-phosphate transport system substrate-binding protein